MFSWIDVRTGSFVLAVGNRDGLPAGCGESSSLAVKSIGCVFLFTLSVGFAAEMGAVVDFVAAAGFGPGGVPAPLEKFADLPAAANRLVLDWRGCFATAGGDLRESQHSSEKSH